jgi:hypothetical protein
MSQNLPTRSHACASKASKQHISQYILITLEQLLLRIISTTPLIYALITKQFFNVPQDHIPAVALLCCIPLWLILVLPFRYRLGGQTAAWFGKKGPDTSLSHYGSWLTQGLMRLLKVLPFILPLLAYLAVIYYNYYFVGFNSFLMLIESSGKLFGGDFVVGVIVLIILMLLLLALAFYGWRKLMPFFYLEEASIKLDSKRRRGLKPNSLKKTTLYNFLIVFPPLVISLVLLGLSMSSRLSGSMMFDSVIIVSAITQFDFPLPVLMQIFAVLAVLYLPFVVFRKASLCACIHHCGSKR